MSNQVHKSIEDPSQINRFAPNKNQKNDNIEIYEDDFEEEVPSEPKQTQSAKFSDEYDKKFLGNN